MAFNAPPTCPNCGAPVTAGSWACRYCGTVLDPRYAGVASLGEVAAAVQASGQTLEQALPGLVASLQEALGDAVAVEYEGGGLMRRERRLRSLTANVGDYRFTLTRTGHGYQAVVEHVVRGIVLRHDVLPPGEWLAQLGLQLREVAARAATVNPALARLLGNQ
jgi:hypothetical protein